MTALLELRNISKRYGEVVANNTVNVTIQNDSIHALLGENGAGKSTLVNIMCGVIRPDEGEIYWKGQRVQVRSPIESRALGIGIVFQHFALFSSLTVLENVALGIGYSGNLNHLARKIETITEQYKLTIDPKQYVGQLSTGEKQRVEIIRCLMQESKLLILDEPTSVLTPIETEHLFNTLRRLRDQGRSILFIGHKLNEIKAVCETATILRKGKWIGDYRLDEVKTDQLAEMMVGTKISSTLQRRKHDQDDTVVLQFNHQGSVDFNPAKSNSSNLSLKLKRGKITGLAGVAGNGQDQLMSLLAGEQKSTKKHLEYYSVDKQDSQYIGHWDVIKRNKAGILFVPTERLGRAAVKQMSLSENAFLGLADKPEYCRYGLINEKKLNAFSNKIIQQYNVIAPSNQVVAGSLSGGNLQKYIIARAILQKPKVLLISNPTWGVDIGATVFIHERLIQLRDSGTAIFIASEDLDEMFSVCDEIAVINNNKLSDAYPVSELNLQKIGAMMTF